MRTRRCARDSIPAVLALVGIACAGYPPAPVQELQRAVSPDRDALDPRGPESAPSAEVGLTPPLSAGLVWLGEARSPGPRRLPAVTESIRKGVLEEAVGALRQEPFGTVAALSNVAEVSDAPPGSHTIDALRSASEHFEYEVALLLQTGAAEDWGFNLLALGYAGLVTMLLIPAGDVAVSSSAELCAVDVRTGLMLGCARGRAQDMDRFLFVWQYDGAHEQLVERTLRAAVAAAAAELRSQVAARLASDRRSAESRPGQDDGTQ